MASENFDFNDGLVPAEFDQANGSFTAASFKLQASGSRPSGARWTNTFDSGDSDGELSCVLNANGHGSGFFGAIFRGVDGSNFWLAYISVLSSTSAELKLRQRLSNAWVDSVETYVIPSWGWTQDNTITVRLDGDNISIDYNAVTDAITHTSSSLNTGTRYGYRVDNTTPSIDDVDWTPAAAVSIDIDDFKFAKDTGGSETVEITGELFVATSAIEYRVNSGSWTTGILSPTIGNYSFDINLTKGQYVIDVRLADNTSETATASYITVCDIVVSAGQSNSSGRGDNFQTYTDGSGGEKHLLLGNDLVYKELADPYDSDVNQVYGSLADSTAAGSFILRFANSYMQSTNEPLAFVSANKGGTGIVSWQKGGSLYTDMTNMINAAGGATRMIWYQGENDCTNGSTLTSYESDLNQFINDVNSDFGIDVVIVALPTLSAANDGNGTTTGQNAIRQAQSNVAASNANASITIQNTDIDLDATGDGVHLKTDFDLNLMGERVYSAYAGITSTLNITFSNGAVPNGTYDVDFYNDTTKLLLDTRSITFTDSTLSELLPVVASTPIFGKVDGDNMPTNGAPFYGVTV